MDIVNLCKLLQLLVFCVLQSQDRPKTHGATQITVTLAMWDVTRFDVVIFLYLGLMWDSSLASRASTSNAYRFHGVR